MQPAVGELFFYYVLFIYAYNVCFDLYIFINALCGLILQNWYLQGHNTNTINVFFCFVANFVG